MLIDLVQELRKKTRDLSDINEDGKKIISYDLSGKIVIKRPLEIYFEGLLRYEANFDRDIIEGIQQQRPLNSGKISYAPAESARKKRDVIISMAKEKSEEKNYVFLYDEKEDKITIKVLKNLRKESYAIGRKLGRPTEKIFDI